MPVVAVICLVIGIVLMVPAFNIAKEPIMGTVYALVTVAGCTVFGILLSNYLEDDSGGGHH